MRKKILIILLILICSVAASSQTGSAIVHTGYQADRPIRVAPGQVLHLTLHGLTTAFNSTQVAGALPLPTDFNGLSVVLQQTGNPQPQLLPLLHGQGTNSCLSSVPLNTSNAVDCQGQDAEFDLVVQIPFELRPNNPGSDNGPCPTPACVLPGLNDAVLTVKERSGQGMSLRIVPVVDQIHFLNTCTDNIDTLGLASPSAYVLSPCFSVITHGDGSWVTASKPARPGEAIVAYAFGLGIPAKPFPTAAGTPTGGVAVNRPFTISFMGGIAQEPASPEYVGLVGGSAGLYQINFRVPNVPASLPPCSPTPNLFTQLPAASFNFGMTLTGTSSLDQASFCVQP